MFRICIYVQINFRLLKPVRPEVRGTTDFNVGAYPPIQNVPLVRPHDTHHFSLRTDGQRRIVNTERRGHHFTCRLW